MARECIKQINLCEPEKCTGCGACSNICPTCSIQMVEDEYAEMHPIINSDTCVKCGQCINVCPSLKYESLYEPKECYAAWRNEENERLYSSSGGISSLLAEWIINHSGVFYGVLYDRKDGIYFSRIDSFNDIPKTRGSKYAQAYIGEVYKNIGVDISQDKKVLFIGSPCQVAGLNSFLNVSKYKRFIGNLISIDFLCHGTVPQKYLFEEIEFLEEKYNSVAKECVFRSNDIRYNYYLTLKNENSVFYQKKAELDVYFYCFLHSISCRQSCMNCSYKQRKRTGDITIGDYIGLGKNESFTFMPGVNPSVVLINNKKGEEILNFLQDNATLIQRTVDEAVEGGPSLKNENLSSIQHNQFRIDYPRYGFVKSTKKYHKKMICSYYSAYVTAFLKRIRNKLYRLIKGAISWHSIQ